MKVPGQNPEKRTVAAWFKEILNKIREKGVNPKDYIEDTETYKSLLAKYYDVAKSVDDAAFWGPAILLFLMLGGYVSRKLEKWNGDAVTKEQYARVEQKINEIVDALNPILEKIEREGPEPVTKSEVQVIQIVVKESLDSLPRSEDID